jgi:hypothetical protein
VLGSTAQIAYLVALLRGAPAVFSALEGTRYSVDAAARTVTRLDDDGASDHTLDAAALMGLEPRFL